MHSDRLTYEEAEVSLRIDVRILAKSIGSRVPVSLSAVIEPALALVGSDLGRQIRGCGKGDSLDLGGAEGRSRCEGDQETAVEGHARKREECGEK